MESKEFRQVFHPARHIFREGEIGDCAYVIERGRVEISALRRGERVRLATLGPPELFGEMALVDDQLRSATATALEETEVVVIPGRRFKHEMERTDPLVRLFLRVLIQRLRSTNRRMIRRRTSSRELSSIDSYLGASVRDDSYREAHQQAIRRLQREEDLRRGLDERQFSIHYQPIVELDDGRIAGVEALLRWRHPTEGIVPPADFIGLAEESGLIVPIGLWLLEEAARTVASARPPVPRSLSLSVNVSPVQIADGQLVDELPAILERSGLSPERLEIEITETVLLDDPEGAIDALERIKALGVCLTVDDFGTGYSSLSYLNRFPVDRIKVDRSFVMTMHEHRVSRLIVRAVVDLARALELEVIAEGVETDAQHRDLLALGCGYGQGYRFARPGEGLPTTESAHASQPTSTRA